jgi:hypothetical protein
VNTSIDLPSLSATDWPASPAATDQTERDRAAFGLPVVALAEPAPGRPLIDHDEAGGLLLRAHAGQRAAHAGQKRFTVVLAGKQGGKTSYGPMWLSQEIERTADPAGNNDYIAGTATFDLFKLKMLPALRDWFERRLGWGRYWSGDRIIELRDPTTGQFWAERADDAMWGRIILRSADSATGWASATARAGWLDEAGARNYTQEILDEAQARVAVARGRLLITTTIYDLGALKSTFYDPWVKAERRHPEIDVIQFDSTDNPEFSPEEFDRLRAAMPVWKFNQRYRGIYERPAGLIYDCFDTAVHTCPRFRIPASWLRYCGLDFGGVNTAAILLAEEPGSERLYAYREYHAGERTAAEHSYYILEGEPEVPFCIGGSKSEGQWRMEFRKGGTVKGKEVALPVNGPDVKEVEIQIARVYATIKKSGLTIFDDLVGLIGDLQDYHRQVDADGEPTETIADESKYHHHAALRYIVSRIRRGG